MAARAALMVVLAGLATVVGCQRAGDRRSGTTPPGPAHTAVGATTAVTPTTVAAVAPDATEVPTAGRPRSGGVSALLAQPPPAMTTVALDAYSGEGYMRWPGRGRSESMTGCPSVDSAPLVDRPLWQTIHFGGTSSGNHPAAGDPWLIAAGLDRAELPRFGRLRGHLGDPRFAHCRDAGRIFVVESVDTVYEPRGPDWLPTPDVATWTAFALPSGGARLRHPASWAVAPAGADTWTLSSPDWPDYPLQVQVIAAGAEPAATRTAVAEYGDTVGFLQQESEWTRAANVPRLMGTEVWCRGDIQAGCVEVRFAHGGTTYVFRQEYGISFGYDARVLAHAQQVLDTFEIVARATITPIPPPNTALGSGPYWTRAQAERMALGMIEGAIVLPEGSWHVTDAQLVPEAEALARGGCDMRRDADNMWYTYPDGVWLLELTAATADRTLVYYTYLDATNGQHLCTAERR